MELLNRENSALILIDVQKKLTPIIHENNLLRKNLKKLVLGCQVLDIPIILTEQYPKGLGTVISELKDALEIYEPIEKSTFSCCGSDEFNDKLDELHRNQLLICGIETHICVYQTCRDLDNNGYYVHLVNDCVGSRDEKNKELAIKKLTKENNIMVTSHEMALFEILRVAKGDQFKQISKIVK